MKHVIQLSKTFWQKTYPLTHGQWVHFRSFVIEWVSFFFPLIVSAFAFEIIAGLQLVSKFVCSHVHAQTHAHYNDMNALYKITWLQM